MFTQYTHNKKPSGDDGNVGGGSIFYGGMAAVVVFVPVSTMMVTA